MGDGWIANEAASIIDIAQSVDNIHTACLDAGRDPASVGIRATLALLPAALHASRPDGAAVDARPVAPDIDAVIAHALGSAERLTAVGVTHLTVPLDSYELDLEGLERLLQALHSQGGSS
jgi:hypothetical protein